MLDIFDVVMWWWLGVNRTLNRPESKTRLDVNTAQCSAVQGSGLPLFLCPLYLGIILI